MTVWNTIDETYSVVPLYRNEATFLDLAPFESISACQCGILVSMIHTPTLSSIYSNEATFLDFASLESIWSIYDSVEYYR